jgi:hypothetical protein
LSFDAAAFVVVPAAALVVAAAAFVVAAAALVVAAAALVAAAAAFVVVPAPLPPHPESMLKPIIAESIVAMIFLDFFIALSPPVFIDIFHVSFRTY